MADIERLKSIYDEKQAKYQALCDAYGKAAAAAEHIKAMCDEAMADMHVAGQQLLNAVKGDQE